MSENTKNFILILDDDPEFRQIIAAPFLAYGYNVLEAHSAQEATTIISNNKIAVAIVDFRLPDIDGISWITQIRESGSRLPIAFISGDACDATTFNRLRHVLKVSMVLQKPVVPELLLEQLEAFLRPITRAQFDQPHAVPSFTQQDLPQQKYAPVTDSMSKMGKQPVDANPDIKQNTSPKQLNALQQVQNAIKLEKEKYFKQLPDEWLSFTNLINQFRDDNTNELLRQGALEQAHRLGGTAGSLGFSEVGSAARRVEELLKIIDTSEPTQYDLILAEIFRLLVHGANSIILEDEGTVTVQVPATTKANTKVLLLTNPATIDEATLSYCEQIDCELDVADISATALSNAKSMAIDGIVVDLTSEDHLQTVQLCRQLRESNIKNNLPMSCIVSPSQPVDAGNLLYSGFSQALNIPVERNELLKTICHLISTRQMTKHRVLIIDDDEVLCNFIASVLSVQGILVKTLNDPVEVMSYVNTFQPDLLLLDVMMPGISGYDVCRLLKATDKWQNLPILYLTSTNTPQGRTLAFKAGGDDFLSKPVIAEELIARTILHLDRALMLRNPLEHDRLTGCLQKPIFYKRLNSLLNDSDSRLACGTVSLVEINHFAELSKQHGRLTLEIVLARLGRLLRMRFPAEALRARLGEKTLALFLPTRNIQETEAAIKLLAQEFADISFRNHKGEEFETNFASSVVNFPGSTQDIESLIGLAHERLVGSREETMDLLGSHKK